MNLITESDLRTFSKCKHLFNIDGRVPRLSKSQMLFKDLVSGFYLLVIKNKLRDIDSDLYSLIKKLIYKYYPDVLPDDFSTLSKYLLDGFYSFLRFFNNDDYSVLINDYSPVVSSYEGVKLSLTFDLLFTQNNKSQFLHAVVFIPTRDNHNTKYDLLNYIKLKFLHGLYSKRRRSRPATYLHLVYIPSIVFNNKNLKSFPLRIETLNEKQVDPQHLEDLKILLSNFKNTTKTFPILGCSDKTCPKRKECTYDYTNSR